MRDRYIDWVAKGLSKKGKTQTGLAQALGIAQPQITRLLAGNREIKAKEVPIIARYIGEDPPDYMAATAHVVGYVGAGQEVVPFEAEEIEEIEAPPTANGEVEAVIVRGDSMYPAYRDRDLIFYEKRQHDAGTLVNRPVVAKLADGRQLVKILRRGSEPGLWTLESFNAPPIENVALEWVVPVRWVEMR